MRAKTLFIASALAVLLGTHGSAQVRTFVATYGLDTNPCTLADPCRNFGPAVAAVGSGGEVLALDSGGYGPVTINRPVTLAPAPGIHAAIAPTSGTAIFVVGGASPTIIRGLYLNGLGAARGIELYAGNFHIENVTVRGFAGYGLASWSGSNVAVTNSSFSENFIGANIYESVGSLSETRLNNNVLGLQVYYNGKASCVDCEISGNSSRGAAASGAWNRYGELVLERCLLANNFTGVYVSRDSASGGGPASLATAWVSDCTITNNQFGTWDEIDGCADCARLYTRMNNTIEGNAFGVVTGPFLAK